MLKNKIESLLFISGRPLNVKQLVKFLNQAGAAVAAEEVSKELDALQQEYNAGQRGLNILKVGDDYQLVTAPDNSALVKQFVKEEFTGELTPASLEALTVIAYRGPISKLDLEQIRGVNCSVILRNLLIRGLIVSTEGPVSGQEYYRVTVDFLKYLGLVSLDQLPDYERLHKVEELNQFLDKKEEKA